MNDPVRPPVDPSSPATPALDVDRGLVFFAGKVAVYAGALVQFGSLYGEGLAGSADYLSDPTEAHAERLRRELHSIGGAGATLGAPTFAEHALALGRSLRDTPSSPLLAASVRALGDELKALIEAMREAAATLAAQVAPR